MFNPSRRGRGVTTKTREKRKWELELERGSESPPPSSRPQRSPTPEKPPPADGTIRTPRGDSESRSARDVFGGGSHQATASAIGVPPGRSCFVFLDIEIGGTNVTRGSAAGRLEIELFAKDCPKTAENFRQLCLGNRGPGEKTGYPLRYADCPIHRIIPGFMAQGGDFQHGDGTGGESIYGGDFEDENFLHRHTTRGLLSMANSGRHTNGSQFFLTFGRTPHLDGKHCVFGRVVGGFSVLDKMEAVGTKSGDPKQRVVISACGEVPSKASDRSGRSQSPRVRAAHSAHRSHDGRSRKTSSRSPGRGRVRRHGASRSRSRSRSRERRR